MDAFLLARLTLELGEGWHGAWVQQAWQDVWGRLVLRLRRASRPSRTAHLLLSPLPEAPGLGILAERPPCPPRPPALAAYLRAHLVGGQLASARCVPFERIADIEFRTRGEPIRLILEAMGRRSSLLIVDGRGAVCVASGRRAGSPGALYVYPPRPEGVKPPPAVTAPDLDRWTAGGELFHRHVLGLSPTLHKEIVHRSGTEGTSSAYRAVVDAYGADLPVLEYPGALSSVPLTHLGQPIVAHAEALPAAGSWLERVMVRAHEDEAARARQNAARGRRDRLERRLEAVQGDMARLPDPEELRRTAAALAANFTRVPAGSALAEISDPWHSDQTIKVALDPSLTPAQNLDRLYERARKAERARTALEARIAGTMAELERPAHAQPGQSEVPAAASVSHGLPFRRYRSSDGWAIWVGRNGKENDRLVREARPWDLWLHVCDGPGAHVLVRLPGRESQVPQRTLAEAAGLAALHSRLSNDGAVEVMYVPAGRLRKPKGASPGRVTVSGERVVRVKPGAGNPLPTVGNK